MGKHYLYAVDVKREAVFYERLHIAIPDSIHESDHEAYIEQAVEAMGEDGVCDEKMHDDSDYGDIQLVDFDALNGKWSLHDAYKTAMSEDGKDIQYVNHVMVEE